jgi:acetyltransferase
MRPASAGQSFDYLPPPYPAHLLALARLPDGTSIVIRPIRADDDALEREFIGGLSSATRYNRLLSGRKLTPDEIRHLTRIDYQREMAFIALTADGRRERILGVARYVRDADAGGAEFALVVADAWQRKGVGRVLLETLLRHAESAGIARLHGITLASNQAMQNLARKLGFALRQDPQDATVRLAEMDFGAGVSHQAGSQLALH